MKTETGGIKNNDKRGNMQPTNRRLIFAGGVLLISACLCLALIGIAGVGVLLFEPQIAEAVFPTVAAPGTPDASSNPDTPTTPQDSSLPSGVAGQMDQIQQEVIELRGLAPAGGGNVTRELLTPAQLRQTVIEDFLEDYTEEEAVDDVIVLSAFGLLEPDFDLYNLYVELFSEQVAGYYDDEAEAMYVVQGEGFQGLERLTYAHEFVHALQDQNYDFEEVLDHTDESCEVDSERCAAISALLEGDASLAETQWLVTYATPDDMEQIQEFYSQYESPVFDSAPAFMREDFIFPYASGQAFVEYLYDQGGWEVVNEAYRNPPVSTEQILHPERYPEDVPVAVEIPDLTGLLGEGWRELDRNQMGEFYSFLILAYGEDPAARVELSVAQQAAAGWEGDQYVVYQTDGRGKNVMVLKTVWDEKEEAAEFSQAFATYAGGRFGGSAEQLGGIRAWTAGEGTSLFVQSGSTTTWVLAPDIETASRVLEAVQAGGG